ncbi:MAG: DUF1552 domain-containing protein [Deltaproteobacteria bacterium]|jgi:hypothetical protein
MRTTRRQWLKAMGLGAGAALCGPLVSRIARGDPGMPRRFVFVVEGNCFEPITMLSDAGRAAIQATADIGNQRWWYRSYRHDAPLVVADDFAGAPALGALTPELAAKTSVVFGLSSRIVGGGHSASHGALSSSRTVGGAPGGPTIDAHVAAIEGVRDGAPFDAVRLGLNSSNSPLDFGTCAYEKGRGAPMILQPRSAFDSLFGSVGDAGSRASFARRRGLLDYAAGDVQRSLAAFSGSGRERLKLERYLESLEELTRRHERLLSLETQLEAARPEPPDTNPLYAGDPLDRFAAQMQLATAALQGGLTNVAVVGSGTGGAFNMTYSSVSSVGRHDLHHGSGGNATYRDAIHEVTRRQFATIAQMASALDAVPENDGTMLDHTAIVFIGDNGEQHHSTASEFPIVVIGGGALGHAAGQTVVYPGLSSDGHRQVSNLWNTIGYWAGEALDEFGAEGPSRRAPGPLAELMG